MLILCASNAFHSNQQSVDVLSDAKKNVPKIVHARCCRPFYWRTPSSARYNRNQTMTTYIRSFRVKLAAYLFWGVSISHEYECALWWYFPLLPATFVRVTLPCQLHFVCIFVLNPLNHFMAGLRSYVFRWSSVNKACAVHLVSLSCGSLLVCGLATKPIPFAHCLVDIFMPHLPLWLSKSFYFNALNKDRAALHLCIQHPIQTYHLTPTSLSTSHLAYSTLICFLYCFANVPIIQY